MFVGKCNSNNNIICIHTLHANKSLLTMHTLHNNCDSFFIFLRWVNCKQRNTEVIYTESRTICRVQFITCVRYVCFTSSSSSFIFSCFSSLSLFIFLSFHSYTLFVSNFKNKWIQCNLRCSYTFTIFYKKIFSFLKIFRI